MIKRERRVLQVIGFKNHLQCSVVLGLRQATENIGTFQEKLCEEFQIKPGLFYI